MYFASLATVLVSLGGFLKPNPSMKSFSEFRLGGFGFGEKGLGGISQRIFFPRKEKKKR